MTRSYLSPGTPTKSYESQSQLTCSLRIGRVRDHDVYARQARVMLHCLCHGAAASPGGRDTDYTAVTACGNEFSAAKQNLLKTLSRSCLEISSESKNKKKNETKQKIIC